MRLVLVIMVSVVLGCVAASLVVWFSILLQTFAALFTPV